VTNVNLHSFSACSEVQNRPDGQYITIRKIRRIEKLLAQNSVSKLIS
jgi:hypothetical protein